MIWFGIAWCTPCKDKKYTYQVVFECKGQYQISTCFIKGIASIFYKLLKVYPSIIGMFTYFLIVILYIKRKDSFAVFSQKPW